MLNLEKIGVGGKLLLLIHALLTLAIALSNIFVNIYLWRISKDLQVLAFFNLFLFLMVFITFIFAGWIARNYDRLWCIRIGVVIHALFYLVILVLKENAVHYVTLLGLFKGIGVGFYHLAEHTLAFDLTDEDNRDFFIGVNGFVASFFGLVAPFISGLMIKKMPGLTGYQVIFTASLILFIGVEILSFFLHPRYSKGEYHLWKVWKNPDPNWRRVLGIIGFYGFRTGIFSFLMVLLVFLASENEFVLGSVSLLMGVLSIISSLALAYLVKPDRRPMYMHISTTMLVIALGFLMWRSDWVGVLIFVIITGLFDPFFDITFESLSFRVIETDTQNDDRRIEYIVARELPLNLGRIMSILIFYLLLGHQIEVSRLRIYLAILIPAPIFISLLLRGIKLSKYKEKKSAELSDRIMQDEQE